MDRITTEQQILSSLFLVFKPMLKEAIYEVMEERETGEKAEEKDTYLTCKETCDKLGVDRSTLWRWNKENYLKAVKLGRKTMYRLSDVKDLMK